MTGYYNKHYIKKGGQVKLDLGNKTQASLQRDIYPVLTEKIASLLKRIPADDMKDIEEIRLRGEKPLMISKCSRDYFVTKDGMISQVPMDSFMVNMDDIEKILQYMCNYSIYAVEEELKQGFLTLRGGHRVGLSGRAVIENGRVKTIKNISGMNIRVAKEIKGCGQDIINRIYSNGLKHTLIASPPGCGKTTLLRDMIRILSSGEYLKRGYKLGIVDERSEIAGCYLGIPQRDVGPRTDVLDSCPKVQGIMMLLRSMSPEIIAVDEIGSLEDSDAIENAINSGVMVIATAHGRDMDEILKKPGVRNLIERKLFERVVILSRKKGPGTIENIIEF